MLEARALERLLNTFHWDSSPYYKAYMEEKKLPFDINMTPEIGLPTPEDTNGKKSGFALLKEKTRMNKLRTDWPKYHFLIICLSNLSRAIHVPTQSPHGLEDSGLPLTDQDQVLFLPSYEFLEKLFVAATKPGSAVALARAYMHHAWADADLLQKLWEVVEFGIMEYDGKEVRPFLMMF
jgi:hypothetical protein